MAKHIIKLNDKKHDRDYYLEWSTVVDAPVTNGMSKKEFEQYYQEEYGNSSIGELHERMKRVEEKGTSSQVYKSVESLILCNRAGYDETELTCEQLVEKYCTNPEQHEA